MKILKFYAGEAVLVDAGAGFSIVASKIFLMQQKSGHVLNNTGAVPSNLFNVLVHVEIFR